MPGRILLSGALLHDGFFTKYEMSLRPATARRRSSAPVAGGALPKHRGARTWHAARPAAHLNTRVIGVKGMSSVPDGRCASPCTAPPSAAAAPTSSPSASLWLEGLRQGAAVPASACSAEAPTPSTKLASATVATLVGCCRRPASNATTHGGGSHHTCTASRPPRHRSSQTGTTHAAAAHRRDSKAGAHKAHEQQIAAAQEGDAVPDPGIVCPHAHAADDCLHMGAGEQPHGRAVLSTTQATARPRRPASPPLRSGHRARQERPSGVEETRW